MGRWTGTVIFFFFSVGAMWSFDDFPHPVLFVLASTTIFAAVQLVITHYKEDGSSR